MSTRWLFVAAMIGFVLASVACAASTSYEMLFVFRFIQGFFGGAVIPIIFSAAFLMFPPKHQTLATVIGGGFAMLAPTFRPLHRRLDHREPVLALAVPGQRRARPGGRGRGRRAGDLRPPDWKHVRKLDGPALALIAIFLTTLELTLKESPKLGWSSSTALALAALCITSGGAAIVRCLRHEDPLVDVTAFKDRTFAMGAWFSFVLGMALFGAIYLLPLFLGVVRDHGPLEIGTIMIVTGVAQLLTAPVATFAEQRIPARRMTAFGYALLAAGLISNAFATYAWDSPELFTPQVLRGVAFMLCLLPVDAPRPRPVAA